MAQSQLQLAALERFLRDYPGITYTTPSSPEYASDREIFDLTCLDTPLAIVHPESTEQVSAIVKFAISNGIKFTVRVGGHNLQGRSMAEGSLTIDIRALNAVELAEDRKTATVGGGILQGELGKRLWDEGLTTPLGSTPSVGYVGWAIYGGYGPLSSHWGLGVDQIVGATLINASGDVVQADDTLLRGIRGAGGVFGVITEVSIRIYPLKSIVAGPILFDSQNISNAFTDFNAKYRELAKDGLPAELSPQQVVFNGLPGRMFGVIFMWSSEEITEGLHWSEKIASLGNVIVNNVFVTTIPQLHVGNAALVPKSTYASTQTHNLAQLTPEVAETIGKQLEKLPADPAAMFSIHEVRGPSATPHSNSVFASRSPHFMLEIMGSSTTQGNRSIAEQWAINCWESIQKTDNTNILDSVYISLQPLEEQSQPDVLSRLFGSHASDVLELKKTYDPQNVFELTIPRLKHFL